MLQIQNSKRDRYKTAFRNITAEKRIGFCPFAVLGDPTKQECLARIKKYLAASPDFLELGIPFSDPIADGPVIQAADERALNNGMTPKKAIALVKKIRSVTERKTHHDIPIGILTYSNIILQYGIEKFYRDLKKAGADSILIADVPLEEIAPFARAAKKYKLHQIFLISEYTDVNRLRHIEKFGSGFLYLVSALGVTGVRQKLSSGATSLVKKFKKRTRLPLMVGFGISHPQHIRHLQRAGADGFIIGSALVKTPTKKLDAILRHAAISARCPSR